VARVLTDDAHNVLALHDAALLALALYGCSHFHIGVVLRKIWAASGGQKIALTSRSSSVRREKQFCAGPEAIRGLLENAGGDV
jgi:hypothetical protein